MQNHVKEPTYRDALLKIGRLSPEFSLFSMFTEQKNFQEIVRNITNQAAEELNMSCFKETVSTRKIKMMKWPRGLPLLTYMSDTGQIKAEELQSLLLNKMAKKHPLVLVPVVVRMQDMSWFFQ